MGQVEQYRDDHFVVAWSDGSVAGVARLRGLHWTRLGDEGFAQSRLETERSFAIPLVPVLRCVQSTNKIAQCKDTHSTTSLLWWLGLCGAQQWSGGQAHGTTAARFGRATQRGDDGQANNFPLKRSWCRSLRIGRRSKTSSGSRSTPSAVGVVGCAEPRLTTSGTRTSMRLDVSG